MTVLSTHISWTHATNNIAWGCLPVSAGCDNCYAETLAKRHGKDFSKVHFHPKAIEAMKKFAPRKGDDGSTIPTMVFVNSMSDVWWEGIPDDYRDKAFDAMEANTDTVFQLLTKRPGVAQRYVRRRYGENGKAPSHLWFGVSVEDNRVKKRIEVLRDMKKRHDISCAFLSVEPLIGPIDECDFTDMDWVLIGGESGGKCRDMHIDWLRNAIDKSRSADAAIWFKQYGHNRNHPAIKMIMAEEGLKITEAFATIVKRGIELEPTEKGGATLDGKVYHELPKAFHDLKARLHNHPVGKRAAVTSAQQNQLF